MAKSVKNALKNSFFQTFGAFGITGLNFVLMLGYARMLGPELLGELTTSQAHVLVWVALVDLGLSNALIGTLTAAEGGKGEFARQGFRARDIVARVLVLRFAGAIIGAGAVLGMAWLRNSGSGALDIPRFLQEIAFLPQLFALVLQNTAVAYATFRNRQGIGQGSMLFSTAVTVALPLWLAHHGASTGLLLLSQSWGGFLSSIIILISFWVWPVQKITRRSSSTIVANIVDRGPWRNAAWRALARDSWPYALSFAAIVLWQRLDQITASEFLGFEQGGQYALAVRLAAIPILMATSVGHALFPDLQRVGMDAPEKISVFMGAISKFAFRYGVLLIGALMLIVALGVAPLVPKFKPALQLLPWFLPGIWVYWIQNFFMGGLFGLRHYWEVIRSYAVAIAVYAALLVPLAKGFGLVGVVLSSNSFSFVLCLCLYRAAKRRKVLPKSFSLAASYSPEEAKLLAAVKQKIFGIFPRINRAIGRG